MKLNIKTLLTSLIALGSSGVASVASASSVATITYGPGFVPVPTMGGTLLIALAVVLALVAVRLLKERQQAGSNLVIAVAASAALASGAGGIKLISDAHADNVLDMSASDGGTIAIPGPGFWVISNSTDVEQTIKAIVYATGCGPGRAVRRELNGAEVVNECQVNTTLAPGATEECEISVFCEIGD